MPGRHDAIGHPALTDETSGLANRLHFDLVYGYLFQGADRGVPLTLMLVSAPAEGSEALRAVGQRIRTTTRTSDLVAHLGGGRFVVILLGTNLSGGRIAADRVETALQDAAPGPFCIGLAQFQPHMKDPDDLLRAVDEALARSVALGGGVEM